MRCTRASVIVILTWMLSTTNDAEAQNITQQCTDEPTFNDARIGQGDVGMADYILTCTAISTQQPPSGSVYYREAAAVVSYDMVSVGLVTQFVRFECSGTSWMTIQPIAVETAPPPSNLSTARTDCYGCGTGPGSDPETLCLRKCGCNAWLSGYSQN